MNRALVCKYDVFKCVSIIIERKAEVQTFLFIMLLQHLTISRRPMDLPPSVYRADADIKFQFTVENPLKFCRACLSVLILRIVDHLPRLDSLKFLPAGFRCASAAFSQEESSTTAASTLKATRTIYISHVRNFVVVLPTLMHATQSPYFVLGKSG